MKAKTVTVRQIEDEFFVNLPDDFGVQANAEFLAVHKNGALILVPKIENPFESIEEGSIKELEEFNILPEEFSNE
ncbi:MAG: hypothetical protein LBM27_06325 [Lactobacillaceae bacterium]|jgi:hypothetical protein|nr:hypothetical protein [Lactobacillaceae bacterium]